jgi:DNA repair exonuclease SbcCD ATPase subunit
MEATMARKRLSDLVREEAKKTPENDSEQDTSKQSSEVKTAKNAESDSQAATKELTHEPTSEKQTAKSTGRSRSKAKSSEPVNLSDTDARAIADSETIDVKAEPVEAHDSTPKSDAFDQKELETIANLQAELEATHQAAQKRETELKQKITQLQTELDQQQTALEQLQADSKQVNQLKAELEDAKKMILQLSQVNAQPAPPKPAPPLVRAAEPELESVTAAHSTAPSSSQDRSAPPKQHQIALRQLLDHPTRPGTLPSMPSEKLKEPRLEEPEKIDIGWMD